MKQLFLIAAFAALTTGAVAQSKSYGPDAFLKKHPTAKSIHWKGDGDQLIIRLKSGATETYNLADAKQKAAAEARWGKLPAAPPPPPKVVMTKFSAPPPPPPAPAIDDKELPPPPPPAVDPPPPPAINCGEAVAPPPPPAPPRIKKKG